MATFQYFELSLSNNWLHANEIEFYNNTTKYTVNSSNVILSTTYNDSSSYNNVKAVDGDSSNTNFFHTSNGSNEYIRINLGGQKYVTKIRIYNEYGTNSGQNSPMITRISGALIKGFNNSNYTDDLVFSGNFATINSYTPTGIGTSRYWDYIIPTITLNDFTLDTNQSGFTLSVSSDNTNTSSTFSYESLNTTIATINSSGIITIIRTGTVNIKVSQLGFYTENKTTIDAATTNYFPGSKTCTLTVVQGKTTPTITDFNDVTKTYLLDVSFNLNPTSTNIAGGFSYISTNTNVATILGSTVFIQGAGSTTINLTQAATTTYFQGTASCALTVNKATTTLSNFYGGGISKTLLTAADASFNLTAPTSDPSGSFVYSYTISDNSVATISQNTVSITGTTPTFSTVSTTTFRETSLTGGITGIALSSDETKLIICDYYNKIIKYATYDNNSRLWSLFTSITGSFDVSENYIGCSLTSDGLRGVAITRTNGTTGGYCYFFTWDGTGYSSFRRTSDTTPRYYNGLDMTGDGSRIVTVARDTTTGKVYFATWDKTINSYTTFTTITIPSTTITNAITGIGISKDGSKIMFSDSNKVYFISWNNTTSTYDGSTITSINVTGTGRNLRFYNGTNMILYSVASNSSYTLLYSTWNGTTYPSFTNVPTSAVPTNLAPWGLYVGLSGTIYVTNTGTSTTDANNTIYKTNITNLSITYGNNVSIVGAGSCIITAKQIETNNFFPKTINCILTVSKKDPGIGDFIDISARYNDASFNLADPSSNSIGAFSYTSSETSVATISQDTISISGEPTFSNHTITPFGFITLPSGGITGIALSSDETKIIICERFNKNIFYATYNNTINKWSSFTSITRSNDVSGNYIGCSLSSDGLRGVAITTGTGTTAVGYCYFFTWDGTTSSYSNFRQTSDTTPRYYNGLDMTGDGSRIVTVCKSSSTDTTGQVYFATWDENNNSYTAFNIINTGTGITNAITGIGITKDGSKIIFSDTDRIHMMVWNNTTKSYGNTTSLETTGIIVRNLRFFNGSNMIFYSFSNNSSRTLVYSTLNTSNGSYSAFTTVTQIPYSIEPWGLCIGLSGSIYITNTGTTAASKTTIYKTNITNVSISYGKRLIIGIPGTSTITARQLATTDYSGGTKSALLTVGRASNAIYNINDLTITYAVDLSFNLVPSSDNRDAPFIYTIGEGDSDKVEISGNKVIIKKNGLITITVSQDLTDYYESASKTITLTVDKATPVLTFENIEITYGLASVDIVPKIRDSDGSITYESFDTNVATISGSTISGSTINILKATSLTGITINVSQDASGNYLGVTTSFTLIVNKASTLITGYIGTTSFTNGDTLTETYGSESIIALSASSIGTDTFEYRYESSDTSIADISGNNVIIVGANNGKPDAEITITRLESDNYLEAKTFFKLKVDKANPNIINNYSSDGIIKTFNEPSFTLIDPSSNSTGLFNYTIKNSDTGVKIADISGNTVTIVAAGTAEITATQQATDNYESDFVTFELKVNKASTLITGYYDSNAFTDEFTLTKIYGEIIDLSASSIGTDTFEYSYTSLNPLVADISGNNVIIVGTTGEGDDAVEITITRSESDNYLGANTSFYLTVNKAIPKINSINDIIKTFNEEPSFTLIDPSSNSTGPFIYTIESDTDNKIADISGNTVTIVAAGRAIIKATQRATPNYESDFVTFELKVNKASTLITGYIGLTSFTEGDTLIKKYGELIDYLSASSIGTDTFEYSYESSDTTIADISENNVIIVGTTKEEDDTVKITITRSESDNYLGAKTFFYLKVDKASTTITCLADNASFINDDSLTRRYESDPIILVPTSDRKESFDFVYSSSKTSIADISGNTVKIVGASEETTTITIKQLGTPNYLEGSISFYLKVDKASTTITCLADNASFINDDSLTRRYESDPIILVPTSGRKETFDFVYSSTKTEIADISGNTVKIVGASEETTTITIKQLGTPNYLEGSISFYLKVDKASTTITCLADNASFINDDSLTRRYESDPIILVPTSGRKETFDFVYSSTKTEIADISGNTVKIVGASEETTTITIKQLGTNNYLEGSISFYLKVDKSPTTITCLADSFSFSNNDTLIRRYDSNPIILLPTSDRKESFDFIYSSTETDIADISGNAVKIVGASTEDFPTSMITIKQDETPNYLGGSISFYLTVNKAVTTITGYYDSIAFTGEFTLTKIYGESIDLSASSVETDTFEYSYESSDKSIADISGNTVKIVGTTKGVLVIITIKRRATVNYEESSIFFNLLVNKAPTTITCFADETLFTINDETLIRRYDSNPIILLPTSGRKETFDFVYLSTETEIADISGNTVKIVGASTSEFPTSTITIKQLGTENYLEGSISFYLKVDKAPTIITASIDSIPFSNGYELNKNYGSEEITLDASSNRIEPFTFIYSSSDTTVASISEKKVSINKGGSSEITILQEATDDYEEGSIYFKLLVGQIDSSIIKPSDLYKILGVDDSTFDLVDPSSNSTGSFSYSSSKAEVATISGNVVTLKGIGSTTIRATQAATTDYFETFIEYDLKVETYPTIILNNNIITKTYGEPDFDLVSALELTSDSSGNFTYEIFDASIADISLNSDTGLYSVTIKKGGSTFIRVTQAANKDYYYLGKYVDVSLNVFRADPSFNFLDLYKILDVDDSTFDLIDPSSNSTGSFSYSSSDVTVADISGNSVTLKGIGSTKISITQQITDNYLAKTIERDLTVETYPKINVSNINKTYGEPDFDLVSALALKSDSSGNFTYEIIDTFDTFVADISLNSGTGLYSVIIKKGGSTTIRVTQEAYDYYLGKYVDVSLNVDRAEPSFDFLNLYKILGRDDSTFDLVDPSSNSAGAFSYSSSKAEVATISGNVVTLKGIGSTKIYITQQATDKYLAKTIERDLTVETYPTINVSDINKTYGEPDFDLVSALKLTSDSSGNFTYEIIDTFDTFVADISLNSDTGLYSVTIKKSGSTTIRVTQEADEYYLEKYVDVSLNVVRAITTISNFYVSNIEKRNIDIPFNLIDPSSNRVGEFIYSSDNEEVATISGSTVTIRGAGTAIITVRQEENEKYTFGSMDTILRVKIYPTISNFNNLEKTTIDPAFNLNPSSDSSGNFTYESSVEAVAIVVGSTVTIRGNGSTTITVTQSATDSHSLGTKTFVLTVKKYPTITNFINLEKTTNDPFFNLTRPQSDSSGNFIYESSDTNVATILGSTVTIVGPGETIITATQAAKDEYSSGTITCILTVKIYPNIDINTFPNLIKTYRDTDFSLDRPNTPSLGAFKYSSTNNSVATVFDGNQVRIFNAGTTNIQATQEAFGEYSSGTIICTLEVNKLDPTITNFNNITKIFNDEPFSLEPKSLSPGLFTYSSTKADVADISGNIVTIFKQGTTTINAIQAETVNYLPKNVTCVLTVNRDNPVLNNINITTFGNIHQIIPNTNSNGAFSYTSSDNNVATISTNEVIIVGAGTVTIEAKQEELDNYSVGTTICNLKINKASPTIRNFNNMTKTYGVDISFNLLGPNSNSNGAFTYTSSDEDVASIVGDVITIKKTGTTEITAKQAETHVYKEAIISCVLTVI